VDRQENNIEQAGGLQCGGEFVESGSVLLIELIFVVGKVGFFGRVHMELCLIS
jgi:hypothetical protein